MAKRKGLGRGLDALLNQSTATTSDSVAAEVVDPASSSAVPKVEDGVLKKLPIEYLQRGQYQPRRDMHSDALEELADSIKAQGVMQPIVVRPLSGNKYEIIAGERRWRASQLAGLDTIPAVIRDVSDEAAIAMALIENIQREDLNPIEEAVALKRLQDEFELTQQQVANAVGKSRTAVTNLLRLINLSAEVKTLLEHGDLEMGHARCLLTLTESQQKQLARHIVAKGLSVRQAESMARKIQQDAQASDNIGDSSRDPDVAKLEERLSEKVGVPVAIQHSSKGKGKLVLQYNNLDELDGILSHLGYKDLS